MRATIGNELFTKSQKMMMTAFNPIHLLEDLFTITEINTRRMNLQGWVGISNDIGSRYNKYINFRHLFAMYASCTVHLHVKERTLDRI